MRSASILRFCAVAISLCLLVAAPAWAATYNEGSLGDLSSIQASPTPFTLTAGANSIIGTVGGSETQDWISIIVPAGLQMTSYVNAAYSGNDAQGFTGFQTPAFTGSVFSTGSYAGYAHFGTGAMNPGINGNTPTTTVGVDLLSTAHYMSDNAAGGTSAGATGYTAPLGPGTYEFLIQQTSTVNTVSYEFDISTTAVPEPATLTLLAVSGAALCLFAARRNRTSN
jgi:hypothetical protein